MIYYDLGFVSDFQISIKDNSRHRRYECHPNNSIIFPRPLSGAVMDPFGERACKGGLDVTGDDTVGVHGMRETQGLGV